MEKFNEDDISKIKLDQEEFKKIIYFKLSNTK